MKTRTDRFWSRIAIEYDPKSLTQEPTYFKNAEEGEAYFAKEFGPDWHNEPWAKFFMTNHEEHDRRTKIRRDKFQSFEDIVDNGRILNFAVTLANNYEYFVMKAVKRGVTNRDVIMQELRGRGYRPTLERVQWFVNKHRRLCKKSNPPKEVLMEFIKFYTQKKFSSRRIEQELTKDSIFLSYRHIQRLQQELKEKEDGDNQPVLD